MAGLVRLHEVRARRHVRGHERPRGAMRHVKGFARGVTYAATSGHVAPRTRCSARSQQEAAPAASSAAAARADSALAFFATRPASATLASRFACSAARRATSRASRSAAAFFAASITA
eukprot:3552132-Prymnesium_polylepis.2